MAKKTKKAAKNAAFKLKHKAATLAHKMFAARRRPMPQIVATPFDKVEAAITELREVCDSRNKKMYALYSARGVKTGLRDLWREIQKAGAHARTVIDDLVNLAVNEHSQLLKPKPVSRSIPVPTVKDLYQDLDGLTAKFGGWRLSGNTLSVTTPHVELSDGDYGPFDFGPFEITLDLTPGKADYERYRANALEPFCVDGFPHPHVESCGHLCEGEAGEPIQHVLNNGLLYEMFLIIYNTLTTYNCRSPYVKLELWDDYGDRNGPGDRDEEYYCESCDYAMSGDEYYRCEACNRIMCSECVAYCERGDVWICARCQSSGDECCSHYGERDCLIHENDPCDQCGEIASDDDAETCPLTGLRLCHTCMEDMASGDDPCIHTMAPSSTIKHKMGARADGICQYVCSDSRSKKVAQCLLRSEESYVYEPEEGTTETLGKK